MAGFRHFVNKEFSDNQENRNEYDYEDSQDPDLYSSYQNSPSLFSEPPIQPHRRTSTPIPYFQPRGFPMAQGLNNFQGFVPNVQRHVFQPSFFESQYQSDSIQPNVATQESLRSRSEGTQERDEDPEKGKNRWTTAETDALVFSWRESFVDLESHKNPVAWKRILEAVNKKGKKRTLDQVKKKLRNLRDRYKDAKDKNKKSGSGKNLPKYYDIFDEVLGTRSLVQLGEVRESGQRHPPAEFEEATALVTDKPADETDINTPTAQNDLAANQDTEETQPKRSKKKKASKSAAATQLIDFLGEIQKQQQETMTQFIEGMQKIEESSRKHTADTLLCVANLFAKGRHGKRGGKRGRRDESSPSESESD